MFSKTNSEHAGVQMEESNIVEHRTVREIVAKKLKRAKQIITVEPLVALYQMAQFLSKPALDNLEFEKSCRVNLNYSNSICQAILSGHHENYSSQNERIQILISNMHSWQQPVQSFMPLLLVLFLGSYSDRHRWRKPFLLLPVLGEIFGVFGCILSVIYMQSWPLEAQGISQKIIPSLFGGQTMLIMASTSYIADVSSIEMRTLRLGIVQVVLSVCSPSVSLFSGLLFTKIGYIGILTISATLHFISFIYGLCWIKESRNQEKHSRKFFLADLFDPSHAVDTFNLICKETPGTDRLHILTLIAVIFIYRGAFDGESNILYLYTQNVFQWTPVEYSYFITVSGLVHLLGVPIFTKILNLSDLMILFITVINKIITNLIFGLANSVTVFYIGVFISIITRIFKVVKKSITTKVVSENDIGKAQSLLGIFETLAPAAAVPIYNKLVYVNTLTTYPAAFLFFSILFYTICAGLILWMYYKEFKRLAQADSTKNNCEDIIETIHL
ncbi:uncharacterized protein LOC108904838 isoform X2 [Anoplophora glabripennis]|uniref:uncharacterized protein LOC108904838 isoform X2 n=1 Tax=Anoplophora glabripennis TaxID=217634 RepID=UPI000874C762|nr:uncharacterized protein LOC108904838 isoform X2 [Anoplophora glabripennis]